MRRRCLPPSELEGPQRLSQSLIWPLQRAFYARQGRAAWKTGVVPYYPTSNPFFARCQARLAVAFLRDLAAAGALDLQQPVHLVELAAGAGQFAFHFVRRFAELQQKTPALQGLRLVYVMTDLADANLGSWAASTRLRPFVDEGRLDFARFDIEQDTTITLLHSGATLAAGSLRNPLLAVANYAFDTTRQDAFWIKDGQLGEARVVPVSSEPQPDPGAPDVLAHVSLRWEHAPSAAAPYYGDAVLDGILEAYRQRLGDTVFLFPVGAFHALRVLSGLADGRLFLLCSDKAFTDERELRGRAEPGFVLHGGAFSMTVNMHAIGRWFEESGGVALHPAARDMSLRVSALARGLPGLEIPETRATFAETMEGFAPPDYQALIHNLSRDCRTPSLKVLMALLRLGEWDHQIIFAYGDVLAELAKKATRSETVEILQALHRVWENFYPMERDLPYELARICATWQPTHAAFFLAESVRLFGPRSNNLMALGLCCAKVGREVEARQLLDKALAMGPDNPAARSVRDQLAAKLDAAPKG
jgi:hypothetical protein